tara:strand:+ start:218 stop:442 length:225 start_codon:yes stop_codon:yes gene_type:complete
MDYSTRQGLNYLPVWILVGIVPCVIRIRAIAVIHATAITAAPATRRILALALVLDLGLDVGGDGLLAGDSDHVV